MVIGADQDLAIAVENSRIIAEGLPDAELCILHGGGHMVNMEQPAGFNEAILEFLPVSNRSRPFYHQRRPIGRLIH